MSKRKRGQGPISINSDKRDIDVVIPVYSNFEVVEQTIKHLNANSPGIKFGIYLVDDCSPDFNPKGRDFYERAKDFPNVIKVIRHMKNMGFPATVNDGVKEGNSKYILILNSDVYLMAGALEVLKIQLDANSDIAITAPVLSFFPDSPDPARPAGKVQHAGIVFDINGQPYHIFNGWSREHPFINVVRDVNAVTGACMLVRRSLFEEVGGFDPLYEKGTFEDVDLCLRFRMLGYKIRVLPQANGYHATGISAMKANGFPLARNSNLFRARFGDSIPYDDFIFAGM